ncbi:MAG TPA: DISARM system phospholipase D-like protein DrmC [Aldersonia sp.]
MTPGVLDSLVEVATSIPAGEADALARAAASGASAIRSLRGRSAGALRDACTTVLSAVEASAADEVAGVLRGATAAAARIRPSLDIVWTGPDLPGSTLRLNSGVIAGLIDEAERDVLLISFAMYSEATLADALHRAVDRGVFVQLLCESRADNPGFNGDSSPFPNLRARRLCWPAAKRPAGASMHAKALVIDRTIALIGSANITGAAMFRNLEIGVLLRDSRAAAAIADCIQQLTYEGVLTFC